MPTYHYTECGLDNVVIEGISFVTDQSGEEAVVIPAIGSLHKIIAEGIVGLPSKMSGKELRFLRSEMGMTQGELAKIIKVTLLTISRWERDENPIADAAEMLVRLLAVERLKLGVSLKVQTVANRVNLSPRSAPIRIDGRDTPNYRLAA